MALHADIVEAYRYREPRLVALLAAGILFIEGAVISYRQELRRMNENLLELSPIDWGILAFGSFLVAPVLLFAVLYYVSSRCETRPPLPAVIPGVAVATVVGSLLGQLFSPVGFPPLHLSIVVDNPFLFDSRALLAWQRTLEPLVVDLLTAIAALGLARLTHDLRADGSDRAGAVGSDAGDRQ